MNPGDRVARGLTLALLVILLGVALATFRDYGLTLDEPVQQRYGNRLVRWYASFGHDRAAVEQNDTFYYGGLFELAAQAAQRVSRLGVYETRHLVNVLFGLIGIVAAAWMGERLAGPTGGLLSALVLATTPMFYGHAFNNPKDIPFASLFALGCAALLALGVDRPPGEASRTSLALAGLAIGLAAAVRVAGLVLVLSVALPWLLVAVFGQLSAVAGRPSRTRRVARVVADLAILTAAAWIVMVAFWPYAQQDPLRHPLDAFRAFSRFWETMPVLYDGEIVASGQLSRFYMPWLFAITLPETYLVAAILGVWGLAGLWRGARRDATASASRSRLACFGWLAAVTALPVVWAVVNRTPFYNGNRHLLFVVPGLAVLVGSAAAWGLRAPGARPFRVAAASALAVAGAFAVKDMVELHPYQSVYFNRLVGGGLAGSGTRYETDYWCASYKEGLDWVVAEYSSRSLAAPVRVAGHATLVQIEYDLKRSEERRRLFRTVSINDDPHLILATTSLRDNERTPGRVVHVVSRQGVPLLYVFEAKTPQ